MRYVEWRLKAVTKLFADIKATRAQKCTEYERVSKLSNLAPKEQRKEMAMAAAAIDYEAADRQYAVQFEEELSPEELQMFEAENIEMYNELNQLSNEVCTRSTLVVISFREKLYCFFFFLGKKYRIQSCTNS